MSVLPDKIIDEIAWLCSRKEIRDIVSAEIPLGGLHKLRMRIIELKVTDSVDGKLVGDLGYSRWFGLYKLMSFYRSFGNLHELKDDDDLGGRMEAQPT